MDPVFVGGGFAILGTLVGGLVTGLQQSSARRQSRSDRLSDVRRDKAEELLREIAIVQEGATSAAIWSLNHLNGKAEDLAAKVDLSRMEALIDLYFAELKPALDKLHECFEYSSKELSANMTKATNEPQPNGLKIASSKWLLQRQEAIAVFAKAIRQSLPALVRVSQPR